MPTLTVTKQYVTGQALLEAHLDAMKSSMETFFNSTKLSTDNIQDSGITTAIINNTAVTEAKLTASVAGDGLSGGAGSALTVNTDGATLQLSGGNVTAKAAGITRAKQAAVNIQFSSSCGTYSNATNSFTDVVSVTITASGSRPIAIFFVADGSASQSGVFQLTATTAFVALVKDASTTLGKIQIGGASSQGGQGGGFFFLDSSPSAASHTYKIQAAGDGVNSIAIDKLKLVALEL